MTRVLYIKRSESVLTFSRWQLEPWGNPRERLVDTLHNVDMLLVPGCAVIQVIHILLAPDLTSKTRTMQSLPGGSRLPARISVAKEVERFMLLRLRRC